MERQLSWPLILPHLNVATRVISNNSLNKGRPVIMETGCWTAECEMDVQPTWQGVADNCPERNSEPTCEHLNVWQSRKAVFHLQMCLACPYKFHYSVSVPKSLFISSDDEGIFHFFHTY